MADESVSQNFSENPDPQEMSGLEGDIKHSQERKNFSECVPQSLFEWLARINKRYYAMREAARRGEFKVLYVHVVAECALWVKARPDHEPLFSIIWMG